MIVTEEKLYVNVVDMVNTQEELGSREYTPSPIMNCVVRKDLATLDGMMRITKDYMFISTSDKEMIMKIESPETSVIHQGSKIVYVNTRTGIEVETSISDTLPVELNSEPAEMRFEYVPEGFCVYNSEVPVECFTVLE